MIDNYDSFTFNLVQYLRELGETVTVRRNDQLSIADISKLDPEYIVLSPGPCTPDKAGISLEVIREFTGRVPILGVCLGHQVIGQAFGGAIEHAREIMHGKTSPIHHVGTGVFARLPDGFAATRYHSLIVSSSSIPDVLEITAWTTTVDGEPDEIMGFRHRDHAVHGVQFHPESILTEHGHQLLKNFLEAAA